MERLFDSYPLLEDDLLIIRKMTESDATELQKLATDKDVYKYLPTFLFEQKYPDAKKVISLLDAECFDAKDSIILGVYLKSEPDKLIGLAEIYNYEESKQKASIGYRLVKRCWGQGIGTRIAALLKGYLINSKGMRMITAHVMKSNVASAKVLQNNGFVARYPNLMEDWGFEDLVLTDKYAFKRSWLTDVMDISKDEFSLEDRRCISFTQEKAECLLIQLGDGNDRDELEKQVKSIWDTSKIPFDMAFFGVDDWNYELSPWKAPPVFGKDGFGEGAVDTLTFVEKAIPELISRFKLDKGIPVVLGGYSLSAFFSLWSAYQSNLFSAIAAASPSVWFPGWIDFAQSNCPKTKHIYLSLGDREQKTRNQVMSKVDSCVRETEKILREKGVDVFLEWNEGNHFKDTGLRCAKAFSWCLRRLHSLKDN